MQLYNASSLMLFYMLLGSLVFFTTGPPNMTVLLSSGISCLVIYPESEHESHSFVLTLCNPMDCTVLGILQTQNTRVGSLFLLQGSFQPRDQTQVSRIAGRFFTNKGSPRILK